MLRPRLTRAALLASFAVGLLSPGQPADAARKPRRSQPVLPSKAAPDRTATIPGPAAPAPEDETLPKPFNLPSAPRSRMKTCGERWQSIKMAGQAADETWREFATKCLAEKDASQGPSRP
jgi:hypothetical protein